jgi:hypothetical protein
MGVPEIQSRGGSNSVGIVDKGLSGSDIDSTGNNSQFIDDIDPKEERAFVRRRSLL